MDRMAAGLSVRPFGQVRLRLLPVLIMLLLAAAGKVHACAVCLSGITITPGQRLDAAADAVLAFPLTSGGQFRVAEVIKGDTAVGETITQPGFFAANSRIEMSLDGPLRSEDVGRSSGKKPQLLTRDRTSEGWTGLGEIDVSDAEWLRQLAATYDPKRKRPSGGTGMAALVGSSSAGVDWPARLSVVARHLESSEPLVAEIAYGELARSPYSAISSLKSELDVTEIGGWLTDPALVERAPGYTLLMGVVGGPDEARELEARIASALATGISTNLPAMLTADLELNGPSRIDWLVATFFVDRRRTLPEIEAALQALSVHGRADAAISRARVVEAYHDFIQVRRPMAGFMAMELADWKEWAFTDDYADILRMNVVKDPAGEFAILSYLRQSPIRSTTQTDHPN